ncbi:MAG: pyridoxal phosphate-dependent aminotransferase [Armatimonadetes bacterium]|nr:pyridoxal phosphate-dependent aminotransferase [Armatimonadota bacterium]
MNPLIGGLEPSLIRGLNARKRPGDLDLGLGEPTLHPELEPFRRAVQWVERNGCPYTENRGLLELRQEVAHYLGGRPDEVCITHGSQEALYLALRTALDPARDEALIVEPCYLAYPKICAMDGIPHRLVALSEEEGFAPRAERVLRALGTRTRLVVVNSPSNPTARVWPRAELERLAEGLRQHGCRLLCDEVYRELYYTEEAPVSARHLFEGALVAGGLSKSDALTGLRIGWLWAPAELMPLVERSHLLMTTAASTFSQRVALEVIRGGVGRQREIYRERRRRLMEVVKEIRLEAIAPEGAFYMLVRVGGDSLRFALELLEKERVVTIPGIAFGKSAQGWVRVSWAGEPDAVREGLLRLSRFLASDRSAGVSAES